MTRPRFPSIPEIEVFIVQIIALILLVIAGVRLILDAWEPIRRKLRAPHQDHPWPQSKAPRHDSSPPCPRTESVKRL
jgi:hypothetical protein